MLLYEALESRQLLNAAGWSDTINNPYFPLIPGSNYYYTGQSDGDHETDRMIVTDSTRTLDGVTCTAVLDRGFINGKLEEKTYDFYAQDDKGNVWYFGEDTKELDESGKVVSREGSWLAGVNGATPGVIMHADPSAQTAAYYQEFSKGVAEDEAINVDLNATARTPFASFANCLKTQEFSNLEKGVLDEKIYAPGIGNVYSNTVQGGSETLKLKSFELAPEAFASAIDNPYMPLNPGSVWFYKGTNDGEPETNRIIVTDQTPVIAGVTTRAVLDRVFQNGELIEKTYDYFAQDKLGNVWCFGEDSRTIENGKVVDREGTWQVGATRATPGIVMLAHPAIGDLYSQEHAASVAEDQAKVLAQRATVVTPLATYRNCLETEDFSPLGSTVDEHKYYAPGVGLVKSQAFGTEAELLKLVQFIP